MTRKMNAQDLKYKEQEKDEMYLGALGLMLRLRVEEILQVVDDERDAAVVGGRKHLQVWRLLRRQAQPDTLTQHIKYI